MPNLFIYLLEDCEEDQYLFKSKLEDMPSVNFKLKSFSTIEEFSKGVSALLPDIIVTDLNLPDSEGLNTFLKVKHICPQRPIVIFSGSNDSIALKAIQLGAQDYLEKHELRSTLIKRTLLFAKERFLMQKTFEELAIRDTLTKLYNREAFDDRIAVDIDNFQRYNKVFALIFIDLNDFKPINDEFGHLVGDKILQSIASRINTFNRISDFTSRFGGDEFIIIAGNVTNKDELETFIESKRVHFNGSYIVATPEDEILEFDIKMSFGGAIIGDHGENAEELLQYADRAMYQEKKAIKSVKP